MLKMSDIFRIISFLEALSICDISNFMICYFVHQSAFMLRVLKHTCTCQDSSAYITFKYMISLDFFNPLQATISSHWW